MYAIVRESTYRQGELERGRERLDEFQELHAAQPGYAGTLVIEVDPDRWVSVNLWDSEADAAAALPKMVPVVRRLLEPMMAAPSAIVGAGRVVLTDLRKQ